MNNSALANHVLQSIQKDLDFLKSQQYIDIQAYNDILRILPTHLNDTTGSFNGGSPFSNKAAMPPPPSANYNNIGSGSPPPPPNYSTATSLETVKALYDYQGQNPQDLSFQQGDIIKVTEHMNNDWWKGTLQGRTGLFPSSYVEKCSAPHQEKSTPPSTPARNPMPPPPSAASSNTYSYPPPPQSNSVYPPPPSNNDYPPPPPPSNNAYPPPPSNNAYPPPPSNNAYPPPPSNNDYPPPPSNNAYPPPPQQYNNAGYTAPPPQQHAPESSGESSGAGSKASGLFQKVGGQLATAATYGFGGTIGSQAAHALF